MKQNNNLVSPSRIINFLFPDRFKEIPKWIIESAAEFGENLHGIFELYLKKEIPVNDILETLHEERQIDIFNNFLKFIKDEKIKSIKVEKDFKNETYGLHGIIDATTKTTIYDWKIRSNLKSKDNFLTEKIQMITYDLILNQTKNWKLVIFSKNQNKIKIIEKKDIPAKEYIDLIKLILSTKNTIQEREKFIWKYQTTKHLKLK